MFRSPRPRYYTAAATALLAFLFLFTLYKAWTQSILLDEAFTYKTWVAAPFSSFYTVAGYNNHPLNTLLCRLAVWMFGLSEITLRLPAVLLGLVYLVATYRAARILFGPSFWMLLTVALNCANPLVLDHFATARGYGMGLAFWALGTCLALRCVSEPSGARRWFTAGAAFGLAAASYMTEVFAVTAIILVLAALYPRRALALAGGALAAAVPILYGPLRLAHAARIDGESSFGMAVKRFLGALVNYRITPAARWRFVWHMLDRWPYGLFLGLLGLLLIATAALAVRWARAKALVKLDPADRWLLVLAPTVLGTFAMLRVEPIVMGHVFFAERRLLFTTPLLLTAAPLFFYWLVRQGRAARAAGRMGAAALALLALHFASMFTLQSIWGWEYDAGSKTIAGVLRQRKPAESQARVRVGASWFLSDSLNFYRTLYGMDWIEPITRANPGCFYDYYAVAEDGLPGLRRFAPVVLYRSSVAKTALAELGPSVRERLAELARAGFQGPPDCEADLTRREPFATAGKPGVNGHFLRDIMGGAESEAWRWTFERPTFLFDVKELSNLKFRLNFKLPAVTYRETGPVRLTVWINGHPLPSELYSGAEDHAFERPAPPQWLAPDGMAIVQTTLDKYYIAPEDKQKLGYMFVSGGFVN